MATKDKLYNGVVVQGDTVTPVDSAKAATAIAQQQIKNNAGVKVPETANPIIGDTTQQPTQQQTQQTQQQAPTQSAAGSLMNMPGVSDATKQALGNLVTNGYQPSQTVNAALNELNSIIAKQPGAFQSQYSAQLNNLLNQILNREAFSYDAASDPMYRMYREMYTQQGKQAMEDTMGRAAALTGGYGNSYATTAAQQAYQGSLQQLNQIIPELYAQARQAYADEGDLLMSQYGALGDAYGREYGEYQDMYNRWLADRDFAQNQYTDERNFDYGSYSDQLNTWSGIAGMEQDQFNTDRNYQLQLDAMAQDQQRYDQETAQRDQEYALELALAMAEAGKTPSAELLARAGFSQADIDAILKGKGSTTTKSTSTKKSTSGGSKTTAPTTGVLEDTYYDSRISNLANDNAAELEAKKKQEAFEEWKKKYGGSGVKEVTPWSVNTIKR